MLDFLLSLSLNICLPKHLESQLLVSFNIRKECVLEAASAIICLPAVAHCSCPITAH